MTRPKPHAKDCPCWTVQNVRPLCGGHVVVAGRCIISGCKRPCTCGGRDKVIGGGDE